MTILACLVFENLQQLATSRVVFVVDKSDDFFVDGVLDELRVDVDVYFEDEDVVVSTADFPIEVFRYEVDIQFRVVVRIGSITIGLPKRLWLSTAAVLT